MFENATIILKLDVVGTSFRLHQSRILLPFLCPVACILHLCSHVFEFDSRVSRQSFVAQHTAFPPAQMRAHRSEAL